MVGWRGEIHKSDKFLVLVDPVANSPRGKIWREKLSEKSISLLHEYLL